MEYGEEVMGLYAVVEARRQPDPPSQKTPVATAGVLWQTKDRLWEAADLQQL